VKVPSKGQGTEYDRINALMDAGNEARRTTGDNSILALGVVLSISKKRKKDINNSSLPSPRTVFIIDSLKHPEEVTRLREIYSNGFYLLGIHCDTKRRRKHLEKNLHLNASEIDKVIARDEDEHLKHGQRTTDTFHLADFFVRIDGSDDRLQNGLDRLLEILFGNPHITPTFDEYAMFMAFAASLRSADLSRQVGAVIARNQEILSSGANDCPKCTGGLYWPIFDKTASETRDVPGGRDHTRNIDSNKAEQLKIVEEILQSLPMSVDRESVKTALQNSRIMDLTEFGRVVHAEMEALLCCARNGISTRDAEVYGTTFPCHNCAKHIIAAGISRVIYIEPYPKSKAQEFHTDSIQVGFSDTDQLSASLPGEPNKKVWFEAFVGVGPRRFFDLFSVRLGSGYPVKRKDSATGEAVQWAASKECRLRIQMLPRSYLDLELLAAEEFLSVLQRARQ
jgi:deoxycytidylate deaminase